MVSKLSPLDEKQSRSNPGSASDGRADAVVGEGRLMGVDEGHAVGGRIAAGPAASQSASALILGRNFVQTKSTIWRTLAVGGERRMHVEAVAAAGAGRAGPASAGWP